MFLIICGCIWDWKSFQGVWWYCKRETSKMILKLKECSSSGTPKAGEGKRVTVHPLVARVSPQCWGMWEWVVWKPWAIPAACGGQSCLTEPSSADVCPHQQAVGQLSCTVEVGANLQSSQNVCELLECQRENWMFKCKVELWFFCSLFIPLLLFQLLPPYVDLLVYSWALPVKMWYYRKNSLLCFLWNDTV